jgi:hypothetical protein
MMIGPLLDEPLDDMDDVRLVLDEPIEDTDGLLPEELEDGMIEPFQKRLTNSLCRGGSRTSEYLTSRTSQHQVLEKLKIKK